MLWRIRALKSFQILLGTQATLMLRTGCMFRKTAEKAITLCLADNIILFLIQFKENKTTWIVYNVRKCRNVFSNNIQSTFWPLTSLLFCMALRFTTLHSYLPPQCVWLDDKNQNCVLERVPKSLVLWSFYIASCSSLVGRISYCSKSVRFSLKLS